MSFCMKCGAQNPDNAAFCLNCGTPVAPAQPGYVQSQAGMPSNPMPQAGMPQQMAPQQMPPQQMAPQQIAPQQMPQQMAPQQMAPQQMPPQQNMPQTNSQQPSSGKKKNKALPWIIAGASLAVVGLVVGIILIAGSKKHSGAQGALDDYFAAVNNLDRRGIYACCYPDMSGYKEEGSTTRYFTSQYYKSHISNMDYLFFDKNVGGAFLHSYGYSGDYTDLNEYIEMREEYLNDVQEDNTSKTMAGFQASYKLNKMQDASKCTFSLQSGLNTIEVDDVEEWLEKKIDEETEDIKFANITIEWKYGDKLYGYDKNWWVQDGIKDTVSSGAVYKTYESAIQDCKKKGNLRCASV